MPSIPDSGYDAALGDLADNLGDELFLQDPCEGTAAHGVGVDGATNTMPSATSSSASASSASANNSVPGPGGGWDVKSFFYARDGIAGETVRLPLLLRPGGDGSDISSAGVGSRNASALVRY